MFQPRVPHSFYVHFFRGFGGVSVIQVNIAVTRVGVGDGGGGEQNMQMGAATNANTCR